MLVTMKSILSSLTILTCASGLVFSQAKPKPVEPTLIKLPGEQAKLEPGQFEWHPERSPSGPLLVVCSIDDQILYAYRNGVQIARTTISTGRKGKRTPTGVFTILQRKVEHESSIYKGAQMPYMQRLTWGGIAMHAGELPGHPASAGCIRLPLKFSELIYGEMKNGSTVVITKKNSTPSKSKSPSTILSSAKAANPADQSIPKGRVVWEPEKSLRGPVSILLSYADKTIYVWRNGVQIGQSPVGFNSEDQALPEGVFLMLEGEEPADPKLPGVTIHPWSVLSVSGAPSKGDLVNYMRDNFSMPPAFRAAANKVLVPGTILLATRESSTEETRSGPMAIGVPDEQPQKTP